MNKHNFKNEIIDILKTGKVERVKLGHTDAIKMLIDDDKIFGNFFNDFVKDYENVFGDDIGNYLMKIQDFVFRLDLLCNFIPDGSDIDIYRTVLENGDFDLYSGVSYDINETREILDDYFIGLKL